MYTIIVVEDDRELRDLFCNVLRDNGFTPVPAANGFEVFDILDRTHIDLIISGIMMPEMDGFEMIETLRKSDYTMPVLIITAKGSAKDKQKGFHAGADDYMVKPIDVNEMIWRVEALLRRGQILTLHRLKLGSTVFDADNYTVKSGSSEILLPQKEFLLIYKLVTYPGRIITRRQIMDDVWGIDSNADEHTLEVHISRLRERFKYNKDFEIVTARGLGYKVVKKDI